MSEKDTRSKILLIDDNDDTLDLLELFLYQDYRLVTAQNGFEGLRTAETERPDCIITDIMMPVMDGVRFFNELRKRSATADTPVIAATAFAEQGTVKSLMNIGFAAVVSKPFDREVVTEVVARATHASPELKNTAEDAAEAEDAA